MVCLMKITTNRQGVINMGFGKNYKCYGQISMFDWLKSHKNESSDEPQKILKLVDKPINPIIKRVFANGNAVECKCNNCGAEKTASMKRLPKYCENCGAEYDWSELE